ncbi:hypothetical protein M758_9G143600 [Ceratodon purpureus]|nr:hypothetical protein M758_9G143600 [Ceratodon purpureus]
MASSKNMDMDEALEKLPNMWHSQLLRTPLEDPLYCCYSIWCSRCAAYGLRGRVLDNDWSRYQCCGGSMPCSGSWGEEKCPRLCAVLEVIMCFTLAVFVTRSMLQDALHTKNAKCDNCIIANIYHCTPFCTCCACMQTQHKLELDKRDGKINPRKTRPPPQQEMSRY